MSEFSPSRLNVVLSALLDNIQSQHQSRRLCVALSGGLDSVVLLQALAQLRPEHPEWQLRAIHVNHQLQLVAADWATQCLDWSARLNIPCTVLAVKVSDIKDQGVEAAARTARYAALRAELQTDEVLLTAQHADDQLETILIALMRGAGVDGLAAMPAITQFGNTWHARPLLEFTRDELQSWATRQSLAYINDPSNLHTQFDRNYLRHDVIPKLKQRWPSVASTGARSAHHLSEAQSLIADYVAIDFSRCHVGNTLSVEVLRQVSAPRRRAVIRYWLQRNDVLMPSTRVLGALEHDMLSSADDRVPCTRWSDVAVYRYRDHLFLERHYRPEKIDEVFQWNWHQSLQLPHQLGSLSFVTVQTANATALTLNAARLPVQLTVRFRQGGEQLQLPNESFHRELKKLLNDAGVLPWWRGRLPLIYAAQQLVAVGNLWISADFVAAETQPLLQLHWEHDETAVFFDK